MRRIISIITIAVLAAAVLIQLPVWMYAAWFTVGAVALALVKFLTAFWEPRRSEPVDREVRVLSATLALSGLALPNFAHAAVVLVLLIVWRSVPTSWLRWSGLLVGAALLVLAALDPRSQAFVVVSWMDEAYVPLSALTALPFLMTGVWPSHALTLARPGASSAVEASSTTQ